MSDSTSNTEVDYVNPALFTEIPENIEVPGNYVQVIPDYDEAGLFDFPPRILIVAQMRALGSATPLNIYPLLSAGQATNLCGPGSIGETQAIALLATNPTIPVDIICVQDAQNSVAAAGSFTFGGAWTVSGVLPLYVAGVQVLVPYAPTDTPTSLAANVQAAIAAITTPLLPVVATNPAGTPTQTLLTARNKGAEGNTIYLGVALYPGDVIPNGMTVAVAPMSGGLLNPSLANVIASIAGIWYTDVVAPWQDAANETLLTTEMDSRYTATAKLDMYSYGCTTGSYATVAATLNGRNSRFRSTLPITNPQSPHWAVSASIAGICAQTWFNDPSQQVKDIVLPGIVPPLPGDRFPWPAQNLLVPIGGCIYGVLKDGTMTIKRMVSENTVDNTGTATTAWQDPMAAKVSTRIRYDWRTYVSLTYPSNKLADDGSLAAESNPNIATPMRLKGSWAARCNVYGKLGWIEDIQNQCRQSQFARDPNSRNRVNETLNFQRIGNLMVTASALLFEA